MIVNGNKIKENSKNRQVRLEGNGEKRNRQLDQASMRQGKIKQKIKRKENSKLLFVPEPQCQIPNGDFVFNF